MPKRSDQFLTIRTEGALLPADVLQSIASLKVDGVSPKSYHLPPGTKLNESIAQSWSVLQKHWKGFREARRQLAADKPGTELTNQNWLLPLFEELKYGRLTTARSPEIDGRTYAIERFYAGQPIHLIGCNLPLDRRTTGARGAATSSPHSMVQEYLNRGENSLWGFLSNGLVLRILRDNVSLSRQAYVEFDLESMMDGEVYADFALLWMLCHQSRVEAEKPPECWLEKWSQLARDLGTRVLSDLRTGVANAIAALGRGFLAHPRNDALREKLRSGQLSTQDYYRQLLRVVYRLLFLFVAEDRELLHPPGAAEKACQLYDQYYSTRRLRHLADRLRGSKHADLWQALSLVFDALGRPAGCPELGLAPLGSFLWRPASTPDLLAPASKATPTRSASAPTPTRSVSEDELTRSVSEDALTRSASEDALTRSASEDEAGRSSLALRVRVSEQHLGEPSLIANDDLLAAVRALAYVEQDRVRRGVDYRNLGSEELGSVYESLLELHPVLNVPARTFELSIAAGNERKTTGSYYTPDSLVQCLLDSALDPVVDDRLQGKQGAAAEAALLDLKVCDPACGSGHFLIAAAHRLARRLARARTGESEPSPTDYQHALRDVIGRCVYGVDINPMAVELCKVSLWMEALEPGKPLSFLEHHIQCGNALLGATPALLAKGIPDEAFTPIEGDDKKLCTAMKKQNRDERRGQKQLFADAWPWDRLGDFATSLARLDVMSDDTPAALREKEDRYGELVRSADYLYGRFWADSWCAAFVWKKTKEFDYPITDDVFRSIERNPHSAPPWLRAEVERLARQYQFFHWHFAFPSVYRVPSRGERPENEHCGWNGGFDVVLGNPPWERMNLQEKEWFANRRPEIAECANAAQRRKLVEALSELDPSLYRSFNDDVRKSEADSHIARRCGRYPFCGRGDVNTYALFSELTWQMLSNAGRAGIIVQSDIATGDTYKDFFQSLLLSRSLRSLYDFVNTEGLFANVHRTHPHFCLLTITGGPTLAVPDFSFWNTNPTQLTDEERHFELTADDLSLLNPASNTCPVFRKRRDANLVKAVYRSMKPPREAPAPGAGLTLRRMFHMSADADRFIDADSLCRRGYILSGSTSLDETGERFLPVIEPKMVHGYDHRFATYPRHGQEGLEVSELSTVEHLDPNCLVFPRYWIAARALDAKGFSDNDHFFLCFRNVTNTTNERTLIAAILPRYALNEHLPTITATDSNAELQCCLLSNLNSFALDYVLRNKLGGTALTYSVFEQLPLAGSNVFARPWLSGARVSTWITQRVLELTYTAWDLEPFARDCGYDGPPFRWDEERRLLLRCELDATFFHLYGIERDDVDYILETFPIVKRKDVARHGNFRTKALILEIYDELAAAIRGGRPYTTRLDPPPADPRVAHPDRRLPKRSEIDRGMAVGYILLLLTEANAIISRSALHAGLILMSDDELRRKVLGSEPPSSTGTANQSPVGVRGLDQLLDGMVKNGALEVTSAAGENMFRLGPNAASVANLPAEYGVRAKEALRAVRKVGDSQALSAYQPRTSYEEFTIV